MTRMRRASLAALAATTVLIGAALAPAMTASAYQPGPKEIVPAVDAAQCNKFPCVLYPKSAQLPSGRLVAAWESSTGPVVGQTMPLYASDDLGDTWRKLADIKPPAQLSSDAAYAKYTSNWTNPKLFVMPETVGPLTKGTLVLSTVVSGAGANGDGNARSDVAIVLYASEDEGTTWRMVNVIAEGGDQTKDPVWEPFFLVYQGELVVYYSDENDYLSYDTTTGIPVLDPDNADPAADSGGQVLVHKTWDGQGSWSAPVIDVPGDVVDRGNGKMEIGGNRPGMTTVVPTTDGKWLATFEYFAGGANRFKVADSPLEFFADGGNGTDVSQLSSSPSRLAGGGAPVLTRSPGGAILYNASGSGDIWVNASGLSDGEWKRYQTTLPAGYSRNLQYVDGTGRIEILQTAWSGQSLGPIRYGQVDLGHSEGAYYSLVNRKTGQFLSTAADKTQDANLTGDRPDIITWSNNAQNDTQRWHVQAKDDTVTFLNKAGGRAIGIWQGSSSAGARLAQWVDDNGTDKKWTLEPTADGYVHLRSALNTTLLMTAGSAGADVTTATAIDASGDATADDAQEWMLVQEQPTTDALTGDRASDALAPASVVPGTSVAIDASWPTGSIGVPRAGKTARVYAFGSAVRDLGPVTLDADAKGSFTLPADTDLGEARVALVFDDGPLVWDGVTVVSEIPDPTPSTTPTPTPTPTPSGPTATPEPSTTPAAAAASRNETAAGSLATTGGALAASAIGGSVLLVVVGAAAVIIGRQRRRSRDAS